MPGGVAAHLVLNGYDGPPSPPSLWTYSVRNKALWVSHGDFDGSCYCGITVPTLINMSYEGNAPNGGTLGPSCSQAQHPSCFDAGFQGWAGTKSLVQRTSVCLVPEANFTLVPVTGSL